jgi:hypothetical protein
MSRLWAGSLAAVLAEAVRAVERSSRAHLDPRLTPSPAVLTGESWQLVHLLGALGEHATALATRVGGSAAHYAVPADDGGTPAQHVARACRGLAELRKALDDAQRAAREVYAALSHLDVRGPGQDANRTGPSGKRA